MKSIKPDPVLKDYWSNNDRFADLFNQVFFKGKIMIHATHLTDGDTEESTIFFDKERISSISRHRDVIKQYEDIDFVLIGLENQMKIHYAMPVRTMLYDSLRYTKQCKIVESQHRKTKDLNTSDEFLSGMKKEDRLKPVITLVVYYGEKPWDGPEHLSDMMNIPLEFKNLINDSKIHLLQLRQADKYSFKNKDNRDFFSIVNELYGTSKVDIKSFKEKYPNMEIYWETMAAIGVATGAMELVEYAQEHKGGQINMCTALENLKKEGIEEGIEQGIEQERQQSINKSIKMLRKNGIKDTDIIHSIMESYDVSYDELKQLLI